MGNGLQSSGLAGGPIVASSIIPPSGQSAVLASNLGTGSTDIVTKAGTTQLDAAVNATADVFLVGANITNASPTKYFSVRKSRTTLWGTGNMLVWDDVSGNTWQIDANITAATMRFGINSATYLQLRAADGYGVFGYGIELRDSGLTTVFIKTNGAGRIDQSGTDSSGTPGPVTIDKPSGKSAIAAGAATVTITCNQCTAASILLVTFHARDATGLLPVAVPGAGSFTVTTSANCTAALPFSWQVQAIL